MVTGVDLGEANDVRQRDGPEVRVLEGVAGMGGDAGLEAGGGGFEARQESRRRGGSGSDLRLHDSRRAGAAREVAFRSTSPSPNFRISGRSQRGAPPGTGPWRSWVLVS